MRRHPHRFIATLARISGRSDLAGAIRRALSRWEALTRYVADGRPEIANNPVERAIRPLALGRGNHRRFMTDCLGGKIAEMSVAKPTPKQMAKQTTMVSSYEKCDELSQQRGSGTDAGRGTHRRFMTACLAGKVK